MNTCKICKNENNNIIHVAKEMMFGLRDNFRYLECNNCGCLQLIDELPDFSKYYPVNYYSYNRLNVNFDKKIKDKIETLLIKYSLKSFSPGYYFLSKIFGIHHYSKWVKTAKVKYDYKILDIGCGSGDKLLTLYRLGFRNLYGIDPYINNTMTYVNGITIFKKNINELNGKYDFIMMHHSFEHMPDQLNTLKAVNRLLNNQRFLLIRIPIVSSYAWREYGVNWVQLDAPRHLYLHTHKSLSLLAYNSGFSIQGIHFDSSVFQFVGSEQYKKDIPLFDNRSYMKNFEESIFKKNQIRQYRKKAKYLNKIGQGDSVCYFLFKS